jgi:hypothetical protein
MAQTANTGFRFFKSMTGQETSPVPTQIRIANSTTLRTGDAVRVNTGGFVVTAGASAALAGIVTGFVDENGINPFSLGYKTGNPSVTLTGDDQITTSSTNQTSAHYILAEVILDPTGSLLFVNKADGALTQANLFSLFVEDSNSRQISQASASATDGQWQLIILDPESTGGKTADSTKGAFRMAKRQMTTIIGANSGTVVAA